MHPMSLRPSRRCGAAVLAAVCLGTLGLTACSGSSSTSSTSANRAGGADGASGKVQVKASDEAKALLAKARTAASRATSVHVTGPVKAGTVTLDVDLAVGVTSASGTLKAGSGSAEARVVASELFLKGDKAFWEGIQKGLGTQFGDRWLRISKQTGPEFAAVIGLVPVSAALDGLAPGSAAWGTVDGETVAGVKTVGLRIADPSRQDTVYVSAKDPAYPMLVKPGSGGELTFSKWDGEAPKVAPPTETVVDATRFSLHS